MLTLTVATHSEGYYQTLLETCKKNNINIEVLGWKQKFKNLLWKFELVNNRLKNVNDNEIVLFIDGFDTVILCNENEIISKFKNTHCDILFSIETINHNNLPLSNFILKRIWKYSYNGYYLNSGTYIGYCGAIKKLLNNILHNFSNDIKIDQYLLSKYLNTSNISNELNIKADNDFELFFIPIIDVELITLLKMVLNIIIKSKNSYLLPEENKYYKIKNNRIVIKDSHIKPCILHFNANVNGDKIIDSLNYNGKKHYRYKRIPDCLNYLKLLFDSKFLILIIIVMYLLYYFNKH